MKTASKRKVVAKVRRARVLQHVMVRAKPPTVAETIERVLITGDLTPLTPEQRLEYYKAVCKSLGLNPLTRPFDYIAFRETENAAAKLVLYARKDCTEQLRKIHGVAVTRSENRRDGDMYIVTVEVRDKHGRTDAATGVVSLSDKYNKPLSGKGLANAIMRAETKAKRRATLSVSGLGMLDESELDTVDNYGTLTASGRVMFESHTEEVALPIVSQEVVQRKMAEAGQVTPSLFYRYYPESETYQIGGSESLKTANRDLLKDLWSSTVGAIVATPSQLGRLISQFEDRKVPFREAKE